MLYFIIVCIVAFLIAILLINFPRIRDSISNHKKDKKPKEKNKKVDYDKVARKENVSFDEKNFDKKPNEQKVKVDSLEHTELKETPFVNITEDEMKELSLSQSDDLGRKYRKAETNYNTEKELYGDSELDDSELDEELNIPQSQEDNLSEEIKNLSPELKAILFTNILNKRDDV